VTGLMNLNLLKEKNFFVGNAATPFHEDTLRFFEMLSQRLIHESIGKPDMADALALGYWLRRSNISKMQNHFKQIQEVTKGIRVPVGQVFHVSPSNVEVLFAYSWALSTLCGCVSIVRVSSKLTDLTRRIIGVIEQVATESAIVPRWAFISTPKSDVFTIGQLVKESDALVVWGGNQSVESIRTFARKPTSIEVVFPDRESLSVINTDAFNKLSKTMVQELATKLAKDVASFGQQACSSPRVLLWVGSNPNQSSIMGFYESLSVEMAGRGFVPTHSEAAQRRLFVHRLAANSEQLELWTFGPLQVVSVRPDSKFRLPHPGNGVIVHSQYNSLKEVAQALNDGDQTISQFGFDKYEWEQAIVSWSGKAPNRVVPIGTALDFDFIWDSHDLIQEFTRNVVLA
jgi:hypothetical protein